MIALNLERSIHAGAAGNKSFVFNASEREGAQLYAVSGNIITLNFHPGQWQAWQSTARIVTMVAGTQGGKTSFGPLWLHREIIEHGRGDYIACSASYKLFSRKLLPELLQYFVFTLGIGRYHRAAQIIEIANPDTGQFDGEHADDPRCYARIMLGSAQALASLESATAKAIWSDETGHDDFTLLAWEALRRRGALHRARFLITTTLYNYGWLKRRILDESHRANSNIEVISFPSDTNPAFHPEEMAEAERTMQPHRYRMLYKAILERPPGQIYNCFVDDYRETGGHKVKPFDLPKSWTRYVGVDPGVINTAQVWLAHDSAKDIYYVYRITLGPRREQAEFAREAQGLANSDGVRVDKWAVGAKSEKYHQEDWRGNVEGAVVAPKDSEVEKGIDAVIQLFRQGRLFIFDTCDELIEQLLTYSRVLDEFGEATDKIADKSKFHYLDALRYFAMAVTDTSGWQWPEIKATTQRYV